MRDSITITLVLIHAIVIANAFTAGPTMRNPSMVSNSPVTRLSNLCK